MNLLNEINEDFLRDYELSTYRGKFKKIFHTLTAPGFQAVFGYRISRGLAKSKIPLLPAMIQRCVELWSGVSIPPKTEIGPGLVIYHFGGVMINSKAILGKHCTLHHGVTIGNRRPGGPSPQLRDRVLVGTGAVLLGGITIGDDAEIGANAVVLDDVPEGGVAVGIPAKVIRVKERKG